MLQKKLNVHFTSASCKWPCPSWKWAPPPKPCLLNIFFNEKNTCFPMLFQIKNSPPYLPWVRTTSWRRRSGRPTGWARPRSGPGRSAPTSWRSRQRRTKSILLNFEFHLIFCGKLPVQEFPLRRPRRIPLGGTMKAAGIRYGKTYSIQQIKHLWPQTFGWLVLIFLQRVFIEERRKIFSNYGIYRPVFQRDDLPRPPGQDHPLQPGADAANHQHALALILNKW